MTTRGSVPNSTTNDRKVVFVEQFYYPEGWAGAQLPRDITIELARNGFEVEVVCGSDQYAISTDDGVEDPERVGIRIARVPTIFSPGSDIRRFKFLRQLWFYLAAFPKVVLRRSPSLFISQTNPPLVVALVAFGAWLHRRPFLIIAMDLYPEVIFANGTVREGSFLGLALRYLFSVAYRRATRIVALGPTMRARLIEKGVDADRITEIPNWTIGDQRIVRGSQNLLRAEWGLENNRVILYSGNLGVAHDVETPILAFKMARRTDPLLRFVFIGGGARLNEARSLVESHSLEDTVLFKPLVPTSRLPESLGLADVAIVTLRAGFEGLVVPSKLLGYMSRGIPTVYVGPPSDSAALLVKSGGGLALGGDDVEEIANTFLRLTKGETEREALGRAAKSYYQDHLSKEKGLAQYVETVRQVSESRVC